MGKKNACSLGKHINKNTMAQWMTDKKIVWKGISVDCTAFAAACPHCTLGERKSEPISKQSFKDVKIYDISFSDI